MVKNGGELANLRISPNFEFQWWVHHVVRGFVVGWIGALYKEDVTMRKEYYVEIIKEQLRASARKLMGLLNAQKMCLCHGGYVFARDCL